MVRSSLILPTPVLGDLTCAVRAETTFHAAVYAVGLYVDPAAAKSALSKYKGLPSSTVAANQAVFDGEQAKGAALTLADA